MALGDVLVDRDLGIDDVQSSLASLFGVAPQEVLVVADLAELLTEQQPPHRVLCHLTHIPSGEYRSILSIHEGQYASQGRLEVVKRLCAILDCQCLISEEGVNPYRMLRVNATEDSCSIVLDAERLDNNNEYVVHH